MKLHNKVAIITGSTEGIGLAIASTFVQEGAKVTFNSCSREQTDAIVEQFRQQGNTEVLAAPGDVADRDACIRIVQQTLERWGKVDILVNNAGISTIGSSEDLSVEQWQRSLDVNLSGSFYCAQAAAKLAMIPQKRGTILMLSSIFGHVGLHRRAAYCTTKHGIIGLTKALAVEWAQHGIRVNALCPGYILTPMEERDSTNTLSDYTQEEIKRRAPLGRYGTPQEQAKACVWLASDESSYTTGTALLSDGGWLAYGGW
jgi:NAD(P)-dependent dehydrogenase (short-subunit alcohol dehydrogenase family)